MKLSRLPISKAAIRRRRGLAMMLVVCAMALAAILSYAMLCGASLQAVASSNGMAAAIADAQAESGIQLAMYYLLHPQYAPTTVTNNNVTYWPGASNITFATTATPAAQMAGSVTVTVGIPTVNSSTYTDTYPVTSQGSSGSGTGGGTVTRTITTQIQVAMGYSVSHGGTFNSPVSIGGGLGSETVTALNGADAIESNQAVTIGALGLINGNISAPSLGSGSILANLLGSLIPGPPASSNPAPQSSNVFSLTAAHQYLYQGTWYTATAVGPNVASGTTLSPVPATNPLGVYYTTAATTINSNTTITGTLVVPTGKLSIHGTNNTFTAVASMPAVVVNSNLEMNGSTAKLTVNGVIFAGTGITGSATLPTTKLIIVGALLTDTAGITGYNGSLSITFDPTNPLVSVPTLSSVNQIPQSVKILSWTQ